jgi:hypothetical protein
MSGSSQSNAKEPDPDFGVAFDAFGVICVRLTADAV